MGAYENPKILPPPNYAEIFNRNMAAGQAQTEKAFAGFVARTKEKKKKIQGAEDKFDAMTVKIGSLPKALQDNANMLNEEFFNNEMDLINGNVERADYRNKKNDILRTLNDITTDGAALTDLYKNIDNIKLSRYQNDGYVQTIGLANGVKDRAITFDYTQGNRKLTFNNANGDAETIDFVGLDKASLGFNERVDIDNKTLADIASDVGNLQVKKFLIKSSDGNVDSQVAVQMFEGAAAYLPEGIELMTPEQQTEAVQLANAKFRSEQAKGLVNSFNVYMQDDDARGSLFLDNAYEVLVNQANSNDFSKNTLKPNADALITAAVDGLELSKEELNTLKEKLRLGVYKLNEGEDPSGKIRQGMDSISKHVLANQAFDAASQNKVLLNESYQILSPDAIESKRLDLENKELLNRQRRQQLGDSDDDPDTPASPLEYFSGDQGPLGFGSNSSKPKALNRALNNMINSNFFNPDNSLKNTGEIIATIRDTDNQAVYGFDPAEGKKFANIRTAREINEIMPLLIKARESVDRSIPQDERVSLNEQELQRLTNFGFNVSSDVNIRNLTNTRGLLSKFEKYGFDGTPNAMLGESSDNYYEFAVNNKGAFNNNTTPKEYKDGGSTTTSKLLVDLPFTFDAEAGIKLSPADLANLTNELYKQEGVYQYIKFN